MCKSHTKKIGALKLSQQDVGKNCIFRGCVGFGVDPPLFVDFFFVSPSSPPFFLFLQNGQEKLSFFDGGDR